MFADGVVPVEMSLPRESESTNGFQIVQARSNNVFALQHYKALKKYLMLLGVDPYDNSLGGKIRQYLVNFSMIVGILPLVKGLSSKFAITIRNKDFDRTVEAFIPVLTFKVLLDFVTEDWETLKNEIHVLDKITKQGNRIANLYRSTLLSFLVLFLYIPLIPPTLDIIMPLNETRRRQLLFNVNYIFIEVDDHFFAIHLHLSWTSCVSIFIIVTVDSLYMLIIHHASGLFDVCG
ncbi:uncharacterized protein LOC114880724 [Osmia bicornis bicornis]|uniref:uncharacterized protein LOC114880724 n=1 Tax=Osmia bicornis bicornis TaxID=1437191 RepID=UPI001EAF8C34|nr:uncharacterized protein LOC114880724 [Osmia bicornis bicornis]